METVRQKDKLLFRSANKPELNSISGDFEFGEWIWYVYEDRVTWSDGFSQLLGLDSDIEESYELLVECIYPPDFCRVFDNVELFMQTFKPRWFTFRIVHADKSVHLLKCYLEGMKIGNTGITDVIGMCFEERSVKE
ncbi:MAG: PAS domain-containing protein [Bacteroidota bacterium]|nr:PAS domain-containing protein [Bacteroidota bacterium]